MIEKYVIIGDGIAGLSAARKIRELDDKGEIYLIGNEGYYPYYRIKLSKTLSNQIEEDKLLIEKKEWYQEHTITLLKDTPVERVDFEEKKICFQKECLNYTKLLLACGASERIPKIEGIEKENVFGLRTLQDTKRIIEASKKSKNILVVGGGILGLEIAYEMCKCDKKVTVIELADRLMPKQLDQEASYILKKKIEDVGVLIKTGTNIKRFLGDTKIEGFLTDQKEHFETDMVVFSIGIQPNVELFRNTDLAINYGILVNSKMETNIPDVYAAGDVAEYEEQIYGLWNVASQQGLVAGSNMAGVERIYETQVPVVLLNAFDLSLFSIGHVQDEEADEIKEEIFEEDKYQKLLFQHNKLIGSILFGDIKNASTIKSALSHHLILPDVIKHLDLERTIELIKEKLYGLRS